MNFRQTLEAEFRRRRQNNPRYSLRAFARYLGTDHATLSQILRCRRNLSARMAGQFGRRLRLNPAIINEACAQQNAEAILRLSKSPRFRPNSRWIATHTGIPLDAVNAAIHRLLFQRSLVMHSVNRWTFNHTIYA